MLLKLKCPVNNYAWGTKGSESFAGGLALDGRHIEQLDSTKPYAEFWVGTHPNGPSEAVDLAKPLTDVIKENRSLVGSHESEKLAFLFKVLSVGGPLSIQIHPTKAQGKLLHEKDPKNYPDDNHKPEIAIALTEFELLSGFRRHADIAENLQKYFEVQKLLGEEEKSHVAKLACGASPDSLKVIFSRIWRSALSDIGAVVSKIAERIKSQDSKSDLDSVLLHLSSLYPGDVGVLAPLFLNHFKMQPGEATFLGPNIPHAYLKGDCVECMSCSDNTIRAGLTPKFIDVESLVEMLNYGETAEPKYSPNVLSDGTKLFTPDNIDEFWVQELKNSTGAEFKLAYSDASSVVTVLKGSADVSSGSASSQINRGEVLFVGASDSSPPTLKTSADFLAFRAFTPSPRALADLKAGSLKIN